MIDIVDTLPVVRPADHVTGMQQGAWTYESYAQLPEDGRRNEVIDGVLSRAPAPGAAHQSAVTQLCSRMYWSC